MKKICIMSDKKEPRVLELIRRITYVGRSAITDVQIKDRYVSREHLLLRKSGDKLLVMDLRSKNGTFLNGNQLRPGTEVEVKEGDSIVVGLNVICLGEKGSVEALALIRSVYPSNKDGTTDSLASSMKHGTTDTLVFSKNDGATPTLISNKSGLQPVNRKPDNLESDLTVGA
ncbi:MAG: FHA domain-containing protein [Desulfobacteraceae bacterium]|jgi:pSer/pThr/pTyr-binding forkhead associated (FHA) protein